MTIESWLARLATELELHDVTISDDDAHTLLDLARDAAHQIERPAAPLTTFMIGVAVGRGQPLGAAAATATALALTVEPEPAPDPDGSGAVPR